MKKDPATQAEKPPKTPQKPLKQQRLEAALRANLKRRKATQSKG